MKKIVVTGLGCVTPVGNDLKTTWENLLKGTSGIDTIKSFDVSEFDTKIGAEVKNFEIDFIHPKEKRKMAVFVSCLTAN